MVESSPIDIKIVAEGISEVLSQFKNLNDRILAMEIRMQRQSERQTTASEKKKIAEKAKAEKEVEKIEQKRTKALDKELNAMDKAHKRANATIIKDHEKAQKKMERDLEHRKNHFNHTLDHMARHAKAVAAEMAVGMLALGGGMSVGKAIDYSMEREKSAFAFSRQTEVPGKPGSRISKEMAKDLAKPIVAETGIESSKVLGAGSALLSGLGGASEKNNKLVTESLQELVRYAVAEGKDAAELAGEVGKMGKGMDLTKEGILKLARSALTHERTGGRTVAEMAEGMPEIRGAASTFGGDARDNIIKMMGISDLASKKGMPVVPMGAFEKLDDKKIAKINAALAGRGIGRITDAHGKVVDDPQVVMQKIIAATGGNKSKIEDIVGGRGIKAYDAPLKIFNETVGAAKEKLEALAAAFHEENNAMASEAEEKERFAAAMDEADKKLEVAISKVKDKIADHLQPEIEHFADFIKTHDKDIESVLDGAILVAHALTWLSTQIEHVGEGWGKMINLLLTNPALKEQKKLADQAEGVTDAEHLAWKQKQENKLFSEGKISSGERNKRLEAIQKDIDEKASGLSLGEGVSAENAKGYREEFLKKSKELGLNAINPDKDLQANTTATQKLTSAIEHWIFTAPASNTTPPASRKPAGNLMPHAGGVR